MPTNEYYDSTGAPYHGSPGDSNVIESEFYTIELGFMRMPRLLTNALKLVRVNATETGLETATAASVLASSGVELQANKNDFNGYVGLTGYNINFKNVAGTFTSYLTNTNTASRSYTFKDASGTMAFTSDITAAAVGLDNCDNTSDLNKPVSTATQTALNLKVDKTTTVNGHALSANVTVSKSDVVLGNCDNTSDTTKFTNTPLTGIPTAPTAATGTNTTQLATTAFTQQEIDALPAAKFQSKIIDGDFNIWEEGTSQTSNGYGSDTMWFNGHSGTTKVHTQQPFTLGQTDVPGQPGYYSRTVVTSVAGAGNYCSKMQRIESVAIFSGETVTVSFYAKADAVKNVAISLTQNFGTGGAPSADVTAIGAQKIALTTSWVRYTATIAIPSVSGKTLGTTVNNYLALIFWFDAGSTYDTQTATLGQQSGTFEIARVRLVAGSKHGDSINEYSPYSILLTYRYYLSTQYSPNVASAFFVDGYNTAGSYISQIFPFPVEMRSAPTAAVVGTWTVGNCSQPGLLPTSQFSRVVVTVTATGRAYFIVDDTTTKYFTFDARL